MLTVFNGNDVVVIQAGFCNLRFSIDLHDVIHGGSILNAYDFWSLRNLRRPTTLAILFENADILVSDSSQNFWAVRGKDELGVGESSAQIKNNSLLPRWV
jgi:hypothetical protein